MCLWLTRMCHSGSSCSLRFYCCWLWLQFWSFRKAPCRRRALTWAASLFSPLGWGLRSERLWHDFFFFFSPGCGQFLNYVLIEHSLFGIIYRFNWFQSWHLDIAHHMHLWGSPTFSVPRPHVLKRQYQALWSAEQLYLAKGAWSKKEVMGLHGNCVALQ